MSLFYKDQDNYAIPQTEDTRPQTGDTSKRRGKERGTCQEYYDRCVARVNERFSRERPENGEGGEIPFDRPSPISTQDKEEMLAECQRRYERCLAQQDGDHTRDDGDGGGDDTQQQFAWSGRLQGLLGRLNDRIQYLLDNPRGTTPEERQAIINFAKKGILRGERGRLQSTRDAMARQGLLGSPFAASEMQDIRRGTAEDVADLEHKVLIDEYDRRFKELMGTSGMANELLGTSMQSEKLVEILNAARRGESQAALGMLLDYFSTIYGNQDSSYWQGIIGAGLS